MAIQATTRAEQVNEFYRLTASSANDDGLSEHETAASDAVRQYIQYGVWEAQEWYLSNVDPHRWVKTSPVLSFTTNDDGTKYAALPEDFIRVYGDEDWGGLKKANGDRWGTQIDPTYRVLRGDKWYILDTNISGDDEAQARLYLTRLANAPTSLYLDYNYYHTEIASDGDTLDFPTLDVNLIAAFAADRAKDASWFPGGMELKASIAANLRARKQAAIRRGRRSREPRKVKSGKTLGTKWFA